MGLQSGLLRRRPPVCCLSSEAMSARDVVLKLGGASKLAASLSAIGHPISPQAIQQWMSADQIPPGRVSALLAVAKRAKVALSAREICPSFDWPSA